MDTTLLGTPVEIGQIGRELKKIWESTGGTQTRASLLNFAVVGDGALGVEENTRIISNFTQDHSCRALLIARDAEAGAPPVQAWVNAHCHLPRAGAKHVCCEQITLLLGSSSEQLLLNLLFANLDSDLPLYLWWQGDLPRSADAQLWSRVDGILFDSRDWANPRAQLSFLRTTALEAGGRLILCDLNWTRTLHLRQALAQMFDHPENLEQIPRLQRLSITHAPGSITTALLFAAWVSAQLSWKSPRRDGNRVEFLSPSGQPISCELIEAAGSPVSRCELSTGDASVTIQRKAVDPFYQTEVRLPDGHSYRHLLPAGSDELGDLLSEEVTLGGRHRVYLRALEAVDAILE